MTCEHCNQKAGEDILFFILGFFSGMVTIAVIYSFNACW
jgi:hypothetical protein